jgi:hypothetical protein
VNLDSGRDELALPGLQVYGQIRVAYDISPDGRQIVAAARDQDGKPRIWLAPVDRQSAARPIPNIEGDQALFGANGELYYRVVESTAAYIFRVNQDGTGRTKIIDQPVAGLIAVAPGGEWLIAQPHSDKGPRMTAFPLRGGRPLQLSSQEERRFAWSPDRRFFYVSTMDGGSEMSGGKTHVIPLPPGQIFPSIPAEGFKDESEVAKLPGVRVVENSHVIPGPTPGVYSLSRSSAQWNLFRIPLQ